MFGKTGTTTGPKDVWFIGGTADVVAGLYLGFDQPRNMGGYAQGGSLAAPIYKQFFLDALADRQPVPFTAPKNIRMVRIDRRTGRRVYGSWPGRSEEHTSELQSLMRISYAVFCLKKKNK